MFRFTAQSEKVTLPDKFANRQLTHYPICRPMNSPVKLLAAGFSFAQSVHSESLLRSRPARLPRLTPKIRRTYHHRPAHLVQPRPHPRPNSVR